jgi:hypothetical protein
VQSKTTSAQSQITLLLHDCRSASFPGYARDAYEASGDWAPDSDSHLSLALNYPLLLLPTYRLLACLNSLRRNSMASHSDLPFQRSQDRGFPASVPLKLTAAPPSHHAIMHAPRPV